MWYTQLGQIWMSANFVMTTFNKMWTESSCTEKSKIAVSRHHNKSDVTILWTSVIAWGSNKVIPAQRSQTTEDWAWSNIGLVHLPQYHTGFLHSVSTTLSITIQASPLQCFWQLSKHTVTFSSKHDADTFSGVSFTLSSSIIFPFIGTSCHTRVNKQS